ncbi:cytochrome b/b6 domain-containing protein [Thalassobius sp. Cn5-15]|uniref:cytochrome b/b6 domain-containing protein n=1 Tax=Thalassobius sp. Cn5-15 TaxID=2917763 RepID=UPI001EF1D058|nr:cytochrome b/b6 domain-containing protein [Thalassobius sp. Cn5-15]MCG7492627.1 cytochrome b/b6 domain-containing protein [Thalassobius sp. Cn5-15]
MSLTNTQARYGSVAKALHWSVALLILAMLPVGFIAAKLAEATQAGSPIVSISVLTTLFSAHKTFGVLVLILAVLRILWALTQSRPAPLHPERKLETLAAEAVHWMLYAFILLVPLTGWIHHAASSGFAPIWGPFGQDLPFVAKNEALSHVFAQLHFATVLGMVGTLGLHIAGALKHQVIDRDVTLARMLPGRTLPEAALSGVGAEPHGKAASLFVAVLLLGVGAGVTSQLIGQGHDAATPPHTSPSATATPAPLTATATAASTLPVWQVEDGTLALEITQLGNLISGQFDNWQADIRYDPEATGTDKGAVSVDIDIASLSLGTVAAQAMGADYFDSAEFPTARYEATLQDIDGALSAVGSLTIKGIAVPLTLPVALRVEGGQAEASGAFTLDRRAFGIGDTVPDEGTLGFGVDLNFTLKATRQ